ncbi:acyl-CoA dehydrogenase family protein [Nonomuraea thailandensis]
MGMTAKPDGDDWILDGDKVFVTNGPVADLIVVYALTDASLGPFGLTAFLVERGTEGLLTGPDVPKMGLRTSPSASCPCAAAGSRRRTCWAGPAWASRCWTT